VNGHRRYDIPELIELLSVSEVLRLLALYVKSREFFDAVVVAVGFFLTFDAAAVTGLCLVLSVK